MDDSGNNGSISLSKGVSRMQVGLKRKACSLEANHARMEKKGGKKRLDRMLDLVGEAGGWGEERSFPVIYELYVRQEEERREKDREEEKTGGEEEEEEGPKESQERAGVSMLALLGEDQQAGQREVGWGLTLPDAALELEPSVDILDSLAREDGEDLASPSPFDLDWHGLQWS